MAPSELLWLFLPWSFAFVFLGRMRNCPPLPNRIETVKVSIIVPARNEQARLPTLLASLEAQDYPHYELIVVDDNSTDDTAALARAAGATTIAVTEVAPGWIGKPYACWQGAQHASGDVFVFLDADTSLEPTGLRRLVATHQRYGGLVSVAPYHRMQKAYERLSAFFFVVAMGSIRSFTLAGTAIKPDGSFGPCMVCSREDYFRTGGHRLVKAEIVDDVALGRQMNRRGVPSHNFLGEGTISFRMYPGGLTDITEGWTKNSARGATMADPVTLLLIGCWVAGSAVALDVMRLWPTEGLSPWVAAGLIAYIAYVVQLSWLLGRLGNYGLTTALTYPVSLAFFVAILVRSLYLMLVRNRVRWKGRSIPVRSSG
jgi:4,4'-diaponeurosporenoate glycosyltransferase